jgi:hypothetical protein
VEQRCVGLRASEVFTRACKWCNNYCLKCLTYSTLCRSQCSELSRGLQWPCTLETRGDSTTESCTASVEHSVKLYCARVYCSAHTLHGCVACCVVYPHGSMLYSIHTRCSSGTPLPHTVCCTAADLAVVQCTHYVTPLRNICTMGMQR